MNVIIGINSLKERYIYVSSFQVMILDTELLNYLYLTLFIVNNVKYVFF